MILKSIEIIGFKSFPDKTRLVLNKPLTAVVGPNGSGKSNIADALLWVTGEQSAKALRGSKMEDVIFGGTKQRRQLGYAEVTLTLDNSELWLPEMPSEIEISRRYYRSGESEYFVNKKNVRLRDVTELLSDTGLGRDGYGVIGQGRIDDILQARGTERRDIFEEAVGIAKYRSRREEAERRLNSTDENMLRIGDKISELDSMLEPLSLQAETAKRYINLRDEAKTLEVSLLSVRLSQLASEAAAAKDELDQKTSLLSQTEAEIKRIYKDTEECDEQRREAEARSEKLRADISAASERRAEFEKDIAVADNSIKSNNERISALRADITESGKQDSGIEAQIEKQLERSRAIDAEYNELTSEITKTTEARLALSDMAEAEEALYRDLLDSERETAYKIAQQSAARSGIGTHDQELLDRENRLERDIGELESAVKSSADALTEAKKALVEANDEAVSKKNTIRGFEMRVSSRRDKLSSSDDKGAKAKADIEAASARLRALEAMERDYEGYAKPVRLVMQESARGALRGVHGTVGELIKTDSRYNLAIETCLGAAVGNIIVDNEETGKRGISMLHRLDGGRATFLPVSAIKGNPLSERGIENEPGFEGIASNLVESDSKYNNIVLNLLGRTVIARSLDDAVDIGKKYGNRFRIVSLDGQVVNAGGAMTGGSSASYGILSRSDEIAQLRSALTDMNERAKRIDSERAELLREYRAAQFEHESAVADLRDAEDAAMRRTNEQLAAERLYRDNESALKERREQLNNIKTQLSDNEKRSAELKSEIASLEDEEARIKSEIEKKAGERRVSAAEQAAEDAAVSKLRERLSALNAERESIKAATRQLSDIRMEFVKTGKERADSIEELEAVNREITAAREHNSREAQILSGLENEYKAQEASLIARKLEIEGKRAALDKLTRERSSDMINIQRDQSRLSSRIELNESEEAQIIARLWDTYEMTRTEAGANAVPLENERQVKQKVESLKRDMTALGNPNLGAIEEFERLNERRVYLTGQLDDLQTAARDIRKIIEDITSEMRMLFTAGFNEIAESFVLVFGELFGGGEARLYLEDPEDPLNCGIGIAVQPPGKQLRTLTLLSGGERAFVAIALYFSILRVHPAPFVVLDEIEAALDDANVTRFASYLRRMSASTQMIIVTHRRGTMEEADMLIGVTMAEKGVSKLISLSLEEAQLVAI